MRLLIFCAILTLAIACDLEKEVDINLPEYERELMVECYLEEGKPYRVALQESVSYFDPFELPIVNGATVIISHQGISDTLTEGAYLEEEKLYNYGSTTIVPSNYKEPFSIYIQDSLGRTVTGTTVLREPVPIDTITFAEEYNQEDKTAMYTQFSDRSETGNFYRFIAYKLKKDEELKQRLDILRSDRFNNGETFVAATRYRYKQNDTAIVCLYHIEEAYYDFARSIDDAEDANSNPFATPSRVLSNVEGGIGIFTGLTVRRDTIIVP